VVALLSNDDWEKGIAVAGYSAKPGENMFPYFKVVSPGYFPALKARIPAGRNVRDTDTDHSTKVAIVSESFASHYFGGNPAIGRRIGFETDPGAPTDIEIVGVVNNTKYESLQEQSPPEIFIPAAQVLCR